MIYRISSITSHDGIEKTDMASVRRLGRLIRINPLTDIHQGRGCFLHCVDPLKSLITSPVQMYDVRDSGEVVITTMNSVYWLEPVEEDE